MYKLKEMEDQLKLFSGEELKEKGMQQSLISAENKNEGWAKTAYGFLLKYIQTHKEFMSEDVREASAGEVPEPPSKRSWGPIIVQARKAGLIVKKGFRSVKNPKAHRTPATLWLVSHS